ncbi:protein-tyrosine phosphatase-like protein [Aspergillus egyptiacus]|nr:protein-tyrosine phosphatase-like protein [Aspergillus egyptiacus]
MSSKSQISAGAGPSDTSKSSSSQPCSRPKPGNATTTILDTSKADSKPESNTDEDTTSMAGTGNVKGNGNGNDDGKGKGRADDNHSSSSPNISEPVPCTPFASYCAASMDEIVPGLFIGNYASTQCVGYLRANNITAILSLTSQMRPHCGAAFAAGIPSCRMQWVSIADDMEENMLQDMEGMCDFIESIAPRRLRDLGSLDIKDAEWAADGREGAVLVHCHAGYSRSPAAVAAYLMRNWIWTWRRCWSILEVGFRVWMEKELRNSVIAVVTKPEYEKFITDSLALRISRAIRDYTRACLSPGLA